MTVVIGASRGAIGYTCCRQGTGVVHVRMRWGLGPLRPGEPSQAPLWEARGNSRAEKGPPNQEPTKQCSHRPGSRVAAGAGCG